MYLNFELPYFLCYKSIHLFLFVHDHCERTAGPIGMKVGMSIWGGCGKVTTCLNLELLYF